MNETRIRQLAAILVAAVVVLTIALRDLMVVEHRAWRVRAQQNHLDFRGTPSLRGSILAADGTPLAQDTAGFDLEFTYRDFRRHHPVGAAVHGANLLRIAEGLPPLQWTDPETPLRAFNVLARIDFRHLSRFDRLSERPEFLERLPRYANRSSLPRDLGFYLASVVSELTTLPFSFVHARMVARSEDNGPVLDVLRLDLRSEIEAKFGVEMGARAALRILFEERLEELRTLAATIEDERRRRRERFEDLNPPRSEEEKQRRLETPHFDFFARLEELRVSAENLADTHGAPQGGRDALQDTDFWYWLAIYQRREIVEVRDYFALRGRTREELEEQQRADIEEFVERVHETRGRQRESSIASLQRQIDQIPAEIAQLREQLAALGEGFEPRKTRQDLVAAISSLRKERKLQIERLKELLTEQRQGALWSGGIPGFEGEPYRPPPLLDETRQRPLLREIDHRFALSIEIRAERHPGFGVRRTAHREVAEHLGGLGPYLGSVSRVQLDDLVAAQVRGRPSPRDPDAQVEVIAESLEDTGAFRFGGGIESELAVGKELQQTVRGLFQSSERVGRSGIEYAMDAELRGRPGLRAVDEMRSGQETSLRGAADTQPGRDLRITIDPALQQLADGITSDLAPAAERALVVLDPQTGDVLALSGFGPIVRPTKAQPDLDLILDFNAAATFPTFDPSIGSVIKPLIALEYLDGLRTGEYTVPFEDFETCGGKQRYRPDELNTARRFGCEETHFDATQNVARAIQVSCNICFYETFWHSRKTKKGAVAPAMTRRIGWEWNDKRNLIVGLDPRMHLTPREGRRQVDSNGDIVGRSRMVRTVGYDFRVSAIDVARAYAMLATGQNPGVGLIAERARKSLDLGWHRDDLEFVRTGMKGSLFAGSGRSVGNAMKGFLDEETVDAAYGKTGTAFVGYQSQGEGLPRREMYNSWFGSFLGTGPRASLVVVAVAYRVPGPGATGAKVAGRMVETFYRNVQRDEALRDTYFGRFR